MQSNSPDARRAPNDSLIVMTSPEQPGDDEVLTVDQVAAWLKVTESWIRDHANSKRRPHLPSFKAGKYIRFRRGDVRRAINQWTRSAK